MRTLVCAVVAVVIGFAPAVEAAKADKKKGKAITGKVKKIDGSTITVTVKNKKEEMDKEFKVGDDAKVVIVNGDEKKELTAKEGLKAEQLKEGAVVSIEADEDGKVTMLTVGMAKKKKKTE